MPPVPNPVRKKVRPASAGAKLQTHPNFSSGLFPENGRPTTALVSTASAYSLHGTRPKTHAGGPRPLYGSQESPTEVSRQNRRLTVGVVDGIAETDIANRTNVNNVPVSQLLKNKVSLSNVQVS